MRTRRNYIISIERFILDTFFIQINIILEIYLSTLFYLKNCLYSKIKVHFGYTYNLNC